MRLPVWLTANHVEGQAVRLLPERWNRYRRRHRKNGGKHQCICSPALRRIFDLYPSGGTAAAYIFRVVGGGGLPTRTGSGEDEENDCGKFRKRESSGCPCLKPERKSPGGAVYTV